MAVILPVPPQLGQRPLPTRPLPRHSRQTQSAFPGPLSAPQATIFSLPCASQRSSVAKGLFTPAPRQFLFPLMRIPSGARLAGTLRTAVVEDFPVAGADMPKDGVTHLQGS